MSPLENSGKPLFFRVDNDKELRLDAPRRRHGISIRTMARSLSLMQKEALVRSGWTGATWRLASDEGDYLMGDDVAPCPLAFVTAGMAASFMEEICALAGERGVELGGLRLIVDNYYTLQGSVLRGTMVGGALPVELRVEADSRLEAGALHSLVEDAIRQSPVHGLMANVLNNRFTLTHNGRQIDAGNVLPFTGPIPPRVDTFADKALPASGERLSLVTRNGKSPKTDEITTGPGSSFAEEQRHRFHVRGICTLRPDGVKAIEQQLFNPHGTIFHFLSDEGREGTPGRAPDAMSYISAGIAFCFMTQLGRYAKTLKKHVASYSVIQDTHFSAPGVASGGADPVETHVYLESSEDDDFVGKALTMSERTCFLHALCRSQLGVDVTVYDRSKERPLSASGTSERR